MQPDWLSTMDPSDDLAWQAVADCLEENAQPQRAELLRLTRMLCRDPSYPDRKAHEARQMELLAQGVEPFVLSQSNSVGMELVWIPSGRFLMGSPKDEEGRGEDEGPVHEVAITQGFWLGRYPVTQQQYQAVMRKNPSYFSASGEGKGEVNGLNTARFPVETVSWKNAQAFCKKLSGRAAEKREKRLYRLPSEAEWEYSCRGGPLSQPFHVGPSLSSRQANFDGNHPHGGADSGPYLERTCEVGSYRPNALGLYDMHGNVWEWCSDWYDEGYYASSPEADPSGPAEGSFRVIRGGSWYGHGRYCRSAFRYDDSPPFRNFYLGFRVALVPSERV